MPDRLLGVFLYLLYKLEISNGQILKKHYPFLWLIGYQINHNFHFNQQPPRTSPMIHRGYVQRLISYRFRRRLCIWCLPIIDDRLEGKSTKKITYTLLKKSRKNKKKSIKSQEKMKNQKNLVRFCSSALPLGPPNL